MVCASEEGLHFTSPQAGPMTSDFLAATDERLPPPMQASLKEAPFYNELRFSKSFILRLDLKKLAFPTTLCLRDKPKTLQQDGERHVHALSSVGLQNVFRTLLS